MYVLSCFSVSPEIVVTVSWTYVPRQCSSHFLNIIIIFLMFLLFIHDLMAELPRGIKAACVLMTWPCGVLKNTQGHRPTA